MKKRLNLSHFKGRSFIVELSPEKQLTTEREGSLVGAPCNGLGMPTCGAAESFKQNWIRG